MGGSWEGVVDRKALVPELALSIGDRQCLSSSLFYKQALEDNHAPEEALEVMCGWAKDSSKLLLPFSRMVVQGVDNTNYPDLRPWLMGLRAWLAVDDNLQVERVAIVLGGVVETTNPGLLMLMQMQKDKYERWLFRVLQTLSEILLENKVVSTYLGSLISTPECMPWSDWFLQYIQQTYSSDNSKIVKWALPEDIVEMSERLRIYERQCFGETSEERRRAIEMKAIKGPVKGEPWMTRVECTTSNFVQVETLDWEGPQHAMPSQDPFAGEDEGEFSVEEWLGDENDTGFQYASESIITRRIWRVTNHRFDHVSFVLKLNAGPDKLGRLGPNYDGLPAEAMPGEKGVHLFLSPRTTRIVLTVSKRDKSRPFGTWAFKWSFDSISPEDIAEREAEEAAALAADVALTPAGVEANARLFDVGTEEAPEVVTKVETDSDTKEEKLFSPTFEEAVFLEDLVGGRASNWSKDYGEDEMEGEVDFVVDDLDVEETDLGVDVDHVENDKTETWVGGHEARQEERKEVPSPEGGTTTALGECSGSESDKRG
ncbi:unnamed protein product [Choristocarpus tenellus]